MKNTIEEYLEFDGSREVPWTKNNDEDNESGKWEYEESADVSEQICSFSAR